MPDMACASERRMIVLVAAVECTGGVRYRARAASDALASFAEPCLSAPSYLLPSTPDLHEHHTTRHRDRTDEHADDNVAAQEKHDTKHEGQSDEESPDDPERPRRRSATHAVIVAPRCDRALRVS